MFAATKRGSAFVFLSAARALKALDYKSAPHSLFPRKPQVCGKLRALRQKCHFATRNKIIKRQFCYFLVILSETK